MRRVVEPAGIRHRPTKIYILFGLDVVVGSPRFLPGLQAESPALVGCIGQPLRRGFLSSCCCLGMRRFLLFSGGVKI